MKFKVGGILVLMLATRPVCANLAQNVFDQLEVEDSSINVNGEFVQGKILSGLIVFRDANQNYKMLLDEANVNPRELFHLLADPHSTTSDQNGSSIITRRVSENFFCTQSTSAPQAGRLRPLQSYQCDIHQESSIVNAEIPATDHDAESHSKIQNVSPIEI